MMRPLKDEVPSEMRETNDVHGHHGGDSNFRAVSKEIRSYTEESGKAEFPRDRKSG
jgi:hypothetical protein